MRREHDFPQPVGKDERAERRTDPPVQRHEGGETWVHIGNPGQDSLSRHQRWRDALPVPRGFRRRPLRRPRGASGYLAHAVECACGLVDIGASVATEWQRQVDEIQPAAGVHVSMTLGDLQVLSLRPLSRTHMGVIGDSINLAARLNTVAGCDEIVVSNTLYQRLPDTLR